MAVWLYADVAALPADSLDDFRLAVEIFEQFCNDMKLFMATSKTYVTVFHSEEGKGVIYLNASVWVDGLKVTVSTCGQEPLAVQSFKYIGA